MKSLVICKHCVEIAILSQAKKEKEIGDKMFPHLNSIMKDPRWSKGRITIFCNNEGFFAVSIRMDDEILFTSSGHRNVEVSLQEAEKAISKFMEDDTEV
jgi:hypothetical protein